MLSGLYSIRLGVDIFTRFLNEEAKQLQVGLDRST